MKWLLACFLAVLTSLSYGLARGYIGGGVGSLGRLEVPQSGSAQSGIGLVSGWKCAATGAITVRFNGGQTYTAAYGTIREDTQDRCGDTDNGFSFLWNWNRLGDGTHTVEVFDNGVSFGSAIVTVKTLGAEVRDDLSKMITIENFPGPGQTTTLRWEPAQQNFVIMSVGP